MRAPWHRACLLAWLGVAMGGYVPATSATEFDTVRLAGLAQPALRMGGVIRQGDEAGFQAELEPGAPSAIVLSGPGGSVSAAMAIGRQIHARRLATIVLPDTDCASACALIWLAGEPRRLGAGGRIGLHALSLRQQNGSAAENHGFDSGLRSYLTALGFALDTTATIVNTPSAMVRWLDAIELQANGIATERYP